MPGGPSDAVPSRFTAGALLLIVLATAVHAVTLAFLIAGLVLVVTGSTWPLQALGGLLLVFAAVLLPRFPRGPRGPGLMDDGEWPILVALVREVATAVGSPVPTHVGFTSEFNAHAEPTGWRGRTLMIGAPLWLVCDRSARVALLGHELGHFANGDILQSRYVGSAHHAIATWHEILTPDDVGVALLSSPVRAFLRGYLRLMEAANAPSHHRREHLADIASAAAGGSEAAVQVLECLLLHDAVEVACNRVAIHPDRPPLRPVLDDLRTSYGTAERARRRAAELATNRAIDDTHPPTIDRIALIESVGAREPLVTLDEHRSARLDAELQKPVDEALTRLAASYL